MEHALIPERCPAGAALGALPLRNQARPDDVDRLSAYGGDGDKRLGYQLNESTYAKEA